MQPFNCIYLNLILLLLPNHIQASSYAVDPSAASTNLDILAHPKSSKLHSSVIRKIKEGKDTLEVMVLLKPLLESNEPKSMVKGARQKCSVTKPEPKASYNVPDNQTLPSLFTSSQIVPDSQLEATLLDLVSTHQASCKAFEPIYKELLNSDLTSGNIRVFFINNAVAFDIDLQGLSKIMEADVIQHITSNFGFKAKFHGPLQKRQNGNDTEANNDKDGNWGKAYILNPKIIDEAALEGSSKLVYANADTGILSDHQSIKDTYLNTNESYFDATQQLPFLTKLCANQTGPCDDLGHGTHTLSVAVGKLGIAKKAKWISCKNMRDGVGSVESYLGCLEFFIAPGGKVENRPHVIGNSYGCPEEEGCSPEIFNPAVNLLTQAGVMMVVSAGNDGENGCSTITSPPATSLKSLVIGSSRYKSIYRAPFSSSGPLPNTNSTIKSVDLLAPGVSILGAVPNFGNSEDLESVENMDGTSASVPLVGGGIIMMMAACPQLERNIDGIKELLFKSTILPPTNANETQCGSPQVNGINHSYGHGIVNFTKAIELCQKNNETLKTDPNSSSNNTDIAISPQSEKGNTENNTTTLPLPSLPEKDLKGAANNSTILPGSNNTLPVLKPNTTLNETNSDTIYSRPSYNASG